MPRTVLAAALATDAAVVATFPAVEAACAKGVGITLVGIATPRN